MKNETIVSKNVMKRDGSVVPFAPHKITAALIANALDVRGHKGGSIEILSQSDRELISSVSDAVIERLARSDAATIQIEDIQDQVELQLMRTGDHNMARSYILYRAKRSEERAETTIQPEKQTIMVVLTDGSKAALDVEALVHELNAHAEGLDLPNMQLIVDRTVQQCYDEIPAHRVREALLLAVREKMEMYPEATYLAARLKISDLLAEINGAHVAPAEVQGVYVDGFQRYIKKGIEAELLSPELGQFDLSQLATVLDSKRDKQFDYLGIDTLYDRYLLHINDKRIELPQWMFMRVAMGLAIQEINREEKAIQFYNVLSSMDFMSSTPTLFNAGTLRPQLSSCYLTTIADDLDAIYEGIKENALLQKFAGGLGNDWTQVRALNSRIKGTNGKSQGVIPFLKVVNDTAVAVNQGGKRKGAVCAYLETWHLDIEDFLELRKNTGDDRRRTHDMNSANWIPDLFMQRVMQNGKWTLFSPNSTPDLHEVYGKEFEKRYVQYEEAAARGEIKPTKTVEAVTLWRKMLTMLFETGHPWITFKDPCNIRSPQQHAGVVHSSNLCTEIMLNTSDDEIAVCNLGSVNLMNHLMEDATGKVVIDQVKLEKTIRVAMRMLDNVININHYSVPKARNSNLKHRPVGLGIMGFHEMLQTMGVAYASNEAVTISGESQEMVCYYAYKASNELAKERGAYSSFKGSLWDRGIFPHETIAMLEKERGHSVGFEVTPKMDWESLRQNIQLYGMRNSNCCAIAPTATISNIVGVSQAIDPEYQNLYVKSNLGGEYTMVNHHLVKDLKKLGLWDEAMVLDIKHYDGMVGRVERVPAHLRNIYATAFEIEPSWLIECAARRGVWIDQGQSLNIYMAGASGKKLDETYKLAWERGLKTTYYLRTLGASHVEKSTGSVGQLNAVPAAQAEAATDVRFCSIDNPDCEACQ